MNRVLRILALTVLVAVVSCGKAEDTSSSSGAADLPTHPPSTMTVSGTVTAPDGSSTEGMTILTPAGQTSAGSGGAFSVEVYNGVPNLVMALVPGKTFGLSAVWTGDVDADIDLDSTIVAFVLTSPLVATLDQATMQKLDGIIRADEHFPALREALSAAYSSDSPWDDPNVETAAHDLVGSVFGKVAADDSLLPKRLELRRQALELEVVHLALNEAQVHNIDREYVDVEVRNAAGKVEVSLSNEMSMGVGSAHSWIVEIASLKTDAYPFSNGWQAFDISFAPHDVFERDGVLLHRVALPQASLFRYFDLVSLVIDAVTGKLYQAVGLDSVVLLPGDAPGVYIVRAYSGALADEEELDAIPSFPSGTNLHEAAQAVNVALAIWDIVSVIVDTKGVIPVMDKFVIELAFRLSIVRAEYLPKNRPPTMNELSAFLQKAFKTALEVLRDTGVDIAGTAAETKLAVLIKQSKVFSGAAGTLKSVLAGLDVAGKVGHVGDALLMFIEQIWWVSPVETSIIVVGNPWPEEECGECPPTHECVSGECVAEGEPRFTLTWNTNDDLDLHVEDPCGNEIYFGHKTATCQGFQGTLDVDDGAGAPASGGPENIFWEEGAAPTGEYRVWVNYYGAHGAQDEAHWTLTMRIGTDKIERLGILKHVGDDSEEFNCSFDGSGGTCTD